MEIQEFFDINLTNSAQHGFKKKRSTSSLSLKIQTTIAYALDKDNVAIMASLDLSAAFDMVNIVPLIFRVSHQQYARTNGIIVTKFLLTQKLH